MNSLKLESNSVIVFYKNQKHFVREIIIPPDVVNPTKLTEVKILWAFKLWLLIHCHTPFKKSVLPRGIHQAELEAKRFKVCVNFEIEKFESEQKNEVRISIVAISKLGHRKRSDAEL